MAPKKALKCDKPGEELAYCVKCKEKRCMENAEKKESKNGRNMIQGTCNKCGTKMTKFVA